MVGEDCLEPGFETYPSLKLHKFVLFDSAEHRIFEDAFGDTDFLGVALFFEVVPRLMIIKAIAISFLKDCALIFQASLFVGFVFVWP